MTRSYFSILLIFFVCSASAAKSVSPIEFGLLNAVDGKERYQIILKTHREAIRRGVEVDYSGISELHIEIPDNPITIPLCPHTDFKGLKLYVTNNSKSFYLFRIEQILKPINISKQDFIDQTYLTRDEFANGKYLLVINDRTPWVTNRKGYDYGATRKDIILIENHKASNSTIATYDTESSDPVFSYVKVNDSLLFSNIEIYRTEASSKMTFPLRIDNHDSVLIQNVKVFTPGTDKYGDAVFSIYNCTNVLFNNVNISGTYSQNNKYGYGIALDNVWNIQFKNLSTRSEWGIFGNYNVNTAYLYRCDINRFDVHCYGKDVYMEDCTFFDFYNQYSSMYGSISHEKCRFNRSIPCLIDPSFNAYTSFDIYFDDCVFIMEKYKNEIVYLLGFPEACNSRPELKNKCLPNLFVTNCRIVFDDDVREWYIFKSDKTILNSIDHLSKIKVKRLSMNKSASLKMSNHSIKTKKKVKYTIKRLNSPTGYANKSDIIKNIQSL